MADEKFTPGPWIIERDGRLWAGPTEVHDRDRRLIVVSFGRHGTARVQVSSRAKTATKTVMAADEQDRANARLIAVAPEMYYMLCELDEYLDKRADADCDQDGYIPNEEMRLLSQVREILAKATGQPA